MADASQTTQKQVIIFLGAPGSGKGTQAVKLSKALNIPHISTGDLFRQNIRNETALGVKVKGIMNAGRLVPDEVVTEMLFDRITNADCDKGYILDGYPRTIPQAEALQEKIKSNSSVLTININVTDDVVVKRISGRVSCKDCGEIYNVYLNPSEKEDHCDKCGGELYHRSDDNETVVKERLDVYHTQTKPLIAFYQKSNVVVNIDGERAPDDVYKDLIKLTLVNP